MPEEWWEFCEWPTKDVFIADSVTLYDGSTIEYAEVTSWHLDEAVTIADIEDAAADDPDHDWRLRIEGAMGGVVYQRQGCAQWVAIERLDGFA